MQTPLRALALAALPVVPVLLYGLALQGTGEVNGSPAASEERPLLVSMGPHDIQRQATERGRFSCSLPVGRQVAAVRAFAEMLPVFHHPRCFNCHGNYDIMSEAHPGHEESRAAMDSVGGLNPLSDVLTVDERMIFHSDCGSCHDNIHGAGIRGPQITETGDSVLVLISGWMLAPQPMQWVGKDDEELCMLVKRFERDGSQFLDHVVNDHEEVQFVEVAYNGDRALGINPDNGLVWDINLPPEPPTVSFEQLFQSARRWVNLMGAEHGWVGDPECGCVMPGIKLQVEHTWSMDTPGGMPSRQVSDAQFEVTLVAAGEDRPGFYQGELSLDRGVEMTLPASCTGNTSIHESWQFYAMVNSESGDMTVWHVRLPDEPTGYIECRNPLGTARMGADPGVVAGVLGAFETVIPADSTSKYQEASQLGARESLTITVLEDPPGQ